MRSNNIESLFQQQKQQQQQILDSIFCHIGQRQRIHKNMRVETEQQAKQEGTTFEALMASSRAATPAISAAGETLASRNRRFAVAGAIWASKEEFLMDRRKWND